ncbi:hypothetical protein [Piscinibacter defluvii]|uniref:hypothetical protein n=1 Tax=Piscinibacter defluvii TaxID=1796922 RepID=UPI000FDE31DE|nr:hypothetical protein [Piscinibacter defluvii]
MRPWKAVLGIGAACVACCAIPLVGGVAALTAGTAALAAAGSALLACADELAPFGTGLLALAGARTAAGGGAVASQVLWLQPRGVWVTYEGAMSARLSIGLVARRTGATVPTVRYVALCVPLGSS